MSVSKAVPRKFAEDFELVAAHYRLAQLGEYKVAKQAARDNVDEAIKTYSSLAAEIAGIRR
jgi:hypothetical protein